MINIFSSPIFLVEDIQAILDQNLQDKRLEKAFRDIQNDLEALHYLTQSIDKWEKGEYSNQTMYAAYNEYRKCRGKISFQD